MYSDEAIQEMPLEQKTEPQHHIMIDSDRMFSNHKDVYKKGIEKRQARLLSKIEFIKPFLDEDEKVTLITTACSPINYLEQFFGGWVIFYLKRAYLIFTNKRVFHVPTTPFYSYRDSIAHFPYNDCKSITMKGHTLTVIYHTGQKDKFHYINSKERKKIKATFNKKPLPAPQDPILGRTYLCPRCGGELEKEIYECPTCHLIFKNKKRALWISLIAPGGGYFYTGHILMGLLDAFTEIYLTVFVLLSFVRLFSGNPEAIGMLVVFSLLLCVEKAVTIYETNHFIDEFIPLKKQPEIDHEEQAIAAA